MVDKLILFIGVITCYKPTFTSLEKAPSCITTRPGWRIATGPNAQVRQRPRRHRIVVSLSWLYPLVNVYITMGNHHFERNIGKPTINGPFSIEHGCFFVDLYIYIYTH